MKKIHSNIIFFYQSVEQKTNSTAISDNFSKGFEDHQHSRVAFAESLTDRFAANKLVIKLFYKVFLNSEINKHKFSIECLWWNNVFLIIFNYTFLEIFFIFPIFHILDSFLQITRGWSWYTNNRQVVYTCNTNLYFLCRSLSFMPLSDNEFVLFWI